MNRAREALRHAEETTDGIVGAAAEGMTGATSGGTPGRPAGGSVGRVVGGKYRLLEAIGEGGMGVVWMAEQRVPVKRLVALKLIKAGMDSRAVLTRFEAERQALAMMDHPNIARVFDGGTSENGSPYFVMELVKGLPITRYCDERKMSVRGRLDLFMQVCSAVQHAHQKGILHRDLKPSNVLVTEHDGKPVPKVIDFGLAKALGGSGVLTQETLYTAFGHVAGTPLYMAPEQVGINALDVDTRADIYALGVLLYELLTGSTPVEHERLKAAAWEEVRRVIREEEPARPSLRVSGSATLGSLAATRGTEPARLAGMLKGDLDWIVLKALEKERGRRYDSATALAADVARHLADEPVVACPPTAGYRVRKFVRKHRGAVATAGAVGAVLVLSATVITTQWVRSARLARELNEQSAVAESELRRSVSQFVKTQFPYERLVAEANESERMRVARLVDGVYQTMFSLAEDDNPAISQGTVLVRYPGGPKSEPEVSIYGPRAEQFQRRPVQFGYPDAVRMPTPDEKPLTGPEAVRLLSIFARDGIKESDELRKAAESERDKLSLEVYIANLALAQAAMDREDWPEARRRLQECPEAQRGWEWRFFWQQAQSVEVALLGWNVRDVSPDRRRILATRDSVAQIFDLTGNRVGEPMQHLSTVSQAKLLNRGKAVLTNSSGGGVRLWDAETGMPVGSPVRDDQDDSCEVIFSPDGHTLLLRDHAGAHLFDTQSMTFLGKPISFADYLASRLIFSSDGKRLLASPDIESVQLYDAKTGAPSGGAIRPGGRIDSVAFSPDAATLLFASNDKCVRLLDIESRNQTTLHFSGYPDFDRVTFSNDGRAILVQYKSSSDGLQLFDRSSGAPVGPPFNRLQLWQFTSVQRCGPLVLGEENGHVRIWNTSNGKMLVNLGYHQYSLDDAELLPDGKNILTTSSSGLARLWSLLDGRLLWGNRLWLDKSMTERNSLVLLDSAAENAVLTLDSSRSEGAGVRCTRLLRMGILPSKEIIPDPSEANERAELLSQEASTSIPDKAVAKIYSDRIILTRATGGELEFRWQGEHVSSAVIDSLGCRLFGTAGNKIRIWDIMSGRDVATVSASRLIQKSCFTPDGTRLIFRMEDGSAEIWDSRDNVERQKDLEAWQDERPKARAWVEQLLDGPKAENVIRREIVEDRAVPVARRLAGINELRSAEEELNLRTELVFRSLKDEHLTPQRVRVASVGMLAREKYPDRLRVRLEALIAQWHPWSGEVLGNLYHILKRPGLTQDRYEVAADIAGEILWAPRQMRDESRKTLAQIMLALSLYRLGKYDEAIENLTKAVDELDVGSSDPTYWLGWTGLAMAQYKAGLRLDASRSFAKVIEGGKDYEQTPDYPSELIDEARQLILGGDAGTTTQPSSFKPTNLPVAIPATMP